MRSILALQKATLKEGIRSKLFWSIIVFALLLFLTTLVISEFSLAEKEKIIADLGLSLISVFGVAVAVLLGTDLVFKDIEKHSIHVILARPVKRWHYVLGKYLGLMTIIALNIILLAAMLAVVHLLYVGKPCFHLFKALYTIYLELGVIAAIATFFSTFSTSQLISALVTLALFVICHSLEVLKMTADRSGGAVRVILKTLAIILPDLDFFDIKLKVIHQLQIPGSYYYNILLYALGYTILILFLASLIMERREFK